MRSFLKGLPASIATLAVLWAVFLGLNAVGVPIFFAVLIGFVVAAGFEGARLVIMRRRRERRS